MSLQNPSDGAPKSQEQEPRIYTWEEAQDMAFNEALDLTPGTLIQGIPDYKAFEYLNQGMGRTLLQEQKASRVDEQNMLPGISQHLAVKNFHGQFENLRVLVLDPSPEAIDRIERPIPGGPAVSVAYMADMRSSGRGIIGTVSAVRTYAVSARAGRYAELPLEMSPLTVHTDTRKFHNKEWPKILERSQELGRLAYARAIQTAFPGGLPGQGKRR